MADIKRNETEVINLAAIEGAYLDFKLNADFRNVILLLVHFKWADVVGAGGKVVLMQRAKGGFDYFLKDETNHSKNLSVGAGADHIDEICYSGDYILRVYKPTSGRLEITFIDKK
jgi:hypothetical protein